MSSVYKNRSFFTNNEKVQIPDVVFAVKEPAVEPTIEPAVDEQLSDADAAAADTDDTADDAAAEESPPEADADAENVCEEEPPAENDTVENDVVENNAVANDLAENDAAVNDADDDEDEADLPEPESVPAPPPVQPITKELIGQFYSAELRALADEVAQQAYYDALNKKKAELRECVSDVQAAMDELVREQQQFMGDYTHELKYMAVNIAEKMIFEKIAENDQILTRLVMQTVSTIKNADWVNVEISERLVGLVDRVNKELEKPEYENKAHVFPVAGTDGLCRVVTNEGAIVSSIELQADKLRQTFKELDQQETASWEDNG